METSIAKLQPPDYQDLIDGEKVYKDPHLPHNFLSSVHSAIPPSQQSKLSILSLQSAPVAISVHYSTFLTLFPFQEGLFIHHSTKMRYSAAVAIAAFLSQASAHGVITQIQGANGVNMPGLSGTLKPYQSK